MVREYRQLAARCSSRIVFLGKKIRVIEGANDIQWQMISLEAVERMARGELLEDQNYLPKRQCNASVELSPK